MATGESSARLLFDLDDIDAAVQGLDARYLAGEAAVHAHTWSVIKEGYTAANRHELPAFTPDWVNVDHRQARAFAPGELSAYIDATWDVAPDAKIYVEAVHRLSDLGVVVTQVGSGTSQQGFEAEWREVVLLTVDGDLLSRCEMFDEADIDAATAKLDELSRPVRRLENAASRASARLQACFVVRDWVGIAGIFADDIVSDDRRRVVNAGVRQGRDAAIAEISAIADVGTKAFQTDVIATRGERLVLGRTRTTGGDQRPDAFLTEVIDIIGIDADDRIVARVVFDPDDIDAAFEELDARYLAGEAADHAHIWSVIAQGYAAMNRYEVPTFTPNWVTVDHRKGISFTTGGDLAAYIDSRWDVAPARDDLRRGRASAE